MAVLVPDDLWQDVRKRYGRAARRLAHFMQTHPEQHDCIAPAGKEMMKLGHLLRALGKANKEEKEPKQS